VVSKASDLATTLERVADTLAFRLFRIDGREVLSKDALLHALASEMSFPPYFGQNWDALLDCMRDLSWCPASGYVLLFDHADEFWRCCPTDFSIFLEIAKNVASVWRTDSVPFHTFLIGSSELRKALLKIDLEGVCNHNIE
jgi:hypothetical protein